MNPRRALIALLLVNIVIQTGSAVGKGQVPRPSRFVAVGLLFGILSVVGEFGPGAQRLAVSFGALVTLGVGLGKIATIKGWNIGGAPTEVDKFQVAAEGGGGPFTGNQKGLGRKGGATAGGGAGGAW